MFHKLPHLTKRHCKYDIRVRVPDELREIIGKKEITRSLGTGDPVEGRRVYHEKLAEVQVELDAAKRSLNPPTPALLSVDMAKGIALAHFREQIYNAELEANRTANYVRCIAEQLRNNCREWLIEIALDLQDIRSDGELYVTELVDQLLRSNGFPEIALPSTRRQSRKTNQHLNKRAHVDKTSAGYKQLLRWAYLGQIEVLERQHAVISGNQYDLAKSTFGNVTNSPNLAVPMTTLSGGSTPSQSETITCWMSFKSDPVMSPRFAPPLFMPFAS